MVTKKSDLMSGKLEFQMVQDVLLLKQWHGQAEMEEEIR